MSNEEISIFATDSSSEFEGFSEPELTVNAVAKTRGRRGTKSNNKQNKTSSDGRKGTRVKSVVSKVQNKKNTLKIIPPQNESDNDDYCYNKSGPNISVEVNASDIDIFDSEDNMYTCPRARDLSGDFRSVFDTETCENDGFSWDLPKIKAPDRGDAIDESLAKLMNTACTVQCDIESVLSKYCIPSNCELTVPPTVNQEIWRFLDKNFKGHLQDKSFVDIQNLISTSLVPVNKLIDIMKKNKAMSEDAKKCFSSS
ncbi:hypothetical protein ACF0H5_010017 [Mactra antiquata]